MISLPHTGGGGGQEKNESKRNDKEEYKFLDKEAVEAEVGNAEAVT